jgi:hypothetical protein
MQERRIAVLFASAAIVTVSVYAHHGSAVSYDLAQRVVTKGVITEFKYINPHPALFWDVKDDQGKVTHWTGEIAPNVAQLQQEGWGRKRSEAALAPGTAVTVTVSPSRAGGPVGLVQRIENAAGEAILGEIGLGAPPPAPAETKP